MTDYFLELLIKVLSQIETIVIKQLADWLVKATKKTAPLLTKIRERFRTK